MTSQHGLAPPGDTKRKPPRLGSERELSKTTDDETDSSSCSRERNTPTILEPQLDQIPATLKAYPRHWAPWEAVWNGAKGKFDKIPRSAKAPGFGLSTRKEWWSFDEAVEGLETQNLIGIPGGVGFNLTHVRDLVGIDLDHCVAPDGTVAEWAREIAERSDSYVELSPSGHGLRIFVRGTTSADWTNHKRGVEVYAGHAARFLTVTGHRHVDSAEDVQPAPEGFLDWLEQIHRPVRTETKPAHDVEMPDLIAEVEIPSLDNLNLPGHALAFLRDGDGSRADGSQADGSRALTAATRALYESGLDDVVVLTLLRNNPHAWDVALRHRHQDEDRALEYLWKHHCQIQGAKARENSIENDFDDLGPPPDPDPAAEAFQADAGLIFVDFTVLAHQQPPPRQWVVPQWLPRGTATLVAGAGGVGKSLLAEQLAIAVANGEPWLGMPTTQGPVIGLFGEDDEDELKRRAARIFEAGGIDPATGSGGLHLDARAGKPNTLMMFGANRVGQATKLMQQLREQCTTIRPVLVILDNIAQLFAGSENDRAEVTAFCNALTGVARTFDCSVLLLGHPAKSAGSEFSGSTAWEAAVRTRLYLERQDDGTLILSKPKANYAALGQVSIEYREPGVFAPIAVEAGAEPRAVAEARSVVIEAVKTLTRRQQPASHVATTRNFLVRLMKAGDMLAGVSEPVAAKALAALLDAGVLIPNSPLPWKDSSRHPAKGLVVKGADDAI